MRPSTIKYDAKGTRHEHHKRRQRTLRWRDTSTWMISPHWREGESKSTVDPHPCRETPKYAEQALFVKDEGRVSPDATDVEYGPRTCHARDAASSGESRTSLHAAVLHILRSPAARPTSMTGLSPSGRRSRCPVCVGGGARANETRNIRATSQRLTKKAPLKEGAKLRRYARRKKNHSCSRRDAISDMPRRARITKKRTRGAQIGRRGNERVRAAGRAWPRGRERIDVHPLRRRILDKKAAVEKVTWQSRGYDHGRRRTFSGFVLRSACIPTPSGADEKAGMGAVALTEIIVYRSSSSLRTSSERPRVQHPTIGVVVERFNLRGQHSDGPSGHFPLWCDVSGFKPTVHHLEKKIRIQRSTADTHEGLKADGLHPENVLSSVFNSSGTPVRFGTKVLKPFFSL
ncbi:hypothetical protein B0H14DRAFT_3149661 [Mycena olivaceomarginata]|nr:hypothetical protein B0H14DRAFT_3149661 [Mycena olivaceomarginata]